jgi:hypothetical protein
MKNFLFKISLISSPIIISLLIFIFSDPFKIIFEYDDYSKDMKVLNNRDFVSTRVFLSKYPNHNFNSFLFGSSRTMAFTLNQWKKHLDSTASVYSFDAFGESIFGIYSKIKFLDERKVKLKNCLLIFCEDATFQFSGDHYGHIFLKDPLTAHTSYFNFYLEHYKAFLGREFIVEYLKELMIHKSQLAQRFGNEQVHYDLITNAMSHEQSNIELRVDPEKYYQSKMHVFYKRPVKELKGKQKINEKQILMLKEIARIFRKQKTNFHIIISPLYNQIKFNHRDFEILSSIFPGHVSDFSGKNKITEDYRNYYEQSHYLPKIGDSLMQVVYSN